MSCAFDPWPAHHLVTPASSDSSHCSSRDDLGSALDGQTPWHLAGTWATAARLDATRRDETQPYRADERHNFPWATTHTLNKLGHCSVQRPVSTQSSRNLVAHPNESSSGTEPCHNTACYTPRRQLPVCPCRGLARDSRLRSAIRRTTRDRDRQRPCQIGPSGCPINSGKIGQGGCRRRRQVQVLRKYREVQKYSAPSTALINLVRVIVCGRGSGKNGTLSLVCFLGARRRAFAPNHREAPDGVVLCTCSVCRRKIGRYPLATSIWNLQVREPFCKTH